MSFDYMLQQISNTMSHFDGKVKEGVIWPVSAFCIPMEVSLYVLNADGKYDIDTGEVFLHM